jgi:AcrR family transcriptional regulator
LPKVVDHEERRAELLAGCFDLFAERGYALTMRQIARELGVSTGTLYHYFDGKPALFAAMFQWLRDRDIRAATEGVPPEATQAERLARLGEFLRDNQDNLVRAVRVALDYHRHQEDADSRRFLAETVRDYQVALREQLGLADHPQVSAVLLSFLLGMCVHRILDPDSVTVDDHLAVLGLSARAIVGLDA